MTGIGCLRSLRSQPPWRTLRTAETDIMLIWPYSGFRLDYSFRRHGQNGIDTDSNGNEYLKIILSHFFLLIYQSLLPQNKFILPPHFTLRDISCTISLSLCFNSQKKLTCHMPLKYSYLKLSCVQYVVINN